MLCTPKSAAVGVQLEIVWPGLVPVVGIAGECAIPEGVVENAIDTGEPRELCDLMVSECATPVNIDLIEPSEGVGLMKVGAGSPTTLIVTDEVVCTPTLSVAIKFSTVEEPNAAAKGVYVKLVTAGLPVAGSDGLTKFEVVIADVKPDTEKLTVDPASGSVALIGKVRF
jgi:hypothetical protein